jgi:hypothetical protein
MRLTKWALVPAHQAVHGARDQLKVPLDEDNHLLEVLPLVALQRRLKGEVVRELHLAW